ncbi:MAG: DUF1844 domain-containing protein [Proteobacteria bacterium]|nr:DUF1844 domain-containing protein [Pseudomonadota bacterium]
MTESLPSADGGVTRDEIMSELFTATVMQQAQMAVILLGHMPHPETGQTVVDLEGARMFIEQLEMLEVKTKGNLSPLEAQFLKESLNGTRMAYVQAVEHQDPALGTRPAVPPSAAPQAFVAPPAAPPESPAAEDDSRKKFSKKY